MNHQTYDVVIVGAGPSGCACAFMLRNSGLRVAILDKSKFPRDKICGDALSADVINQLQLMDETLLSDFHRYERKQPSDGVRFFAPNGQCLDISFTSKIRSSSAGYISKRIDFDDFLFQKLKDCSQIDVFENQKVMAVQSSKKGIDLKTETDIFKAKMVLGADGAHSIINKSLGNNTLDKNHHCAGLRQYYQNVTGFTGKGRIELHFYKDILPGYFWIFPLPNNQANVGLGMLSSEISKRNVNLKQELEDIIHKHPNIKNRFRDATALESVKGFGLPIGSKKKQLSGDRFLLLGDAANLIDPFTGEGIGNAIRSGRVAAKHLIAAFAKSRFDAKFNKRYDQEIYKRMWNELRIGRGLQRLLKYPRLFNAVVKRANRNPSLKLLLSSMLDDVNLKRELTKPSFYFKLIFK